MTKVSNTSGTRVKWYLSLDRFVELIDKLSLERGTTNCAANGANCKIDSYCGGSVDLNIYAFEWMAAGRVRLVKAIYDKADMNISEIEKIYAKNQKLNSIHTLAVFSNAAKVENKSITLIAIGSHSELFKK
jgi:hypothetical protein